jgi:cell division septal protein FtsQ
MTVCSAIALILAGVVWVAPWVTDRVPDMKKTDFFQLRAIQIEGVSKGREADVRALIEKQPSTSLVGLDLEKIHEALMQLRWAKEVLLRKEWPDTLYVKVSERVPFAWVEDWAPAGLVDRMSIKPGMGHDRLVDEDGIELEFRDHPVSDFPVIRRTGLPGVPGHGQGESSDVLQSELKAGLTVLKAFAASGIGSKDFAELAMEVRVLQEGHYDIRVQYQGLQLRLGQTDPEEQIRRFISLKPEFLAKAPQISELDLRFPGRLIVRSKVEDRTRKYRAAIQMAARPASLEGR